MNKCLLFCLILSPLLSIAQTPDTAKLLDNIIISQNRLQIPFADISRSVDVITRKEIDNAPARSLPELLSYVSGVDIRQRGIGGAQADINIRGGTFDQTLILINGVPLADPQTGHHIMNLPLSNFDIERIEILKGAGARIFGQNAFAGVVNIVTKTPNQGFEGNIGAGFEEMGTYQIRGGVNIGNPIAPTRLSFSRQASEGYRPNSDYAIQTFFLQNRLNLSEKTHIDVIAGHNTRKFGGSGFYAGPAPTYASLPLDNNTNEYEEVTTTYANVSLPFSIGAWTIKPRAYYRRSNDDYYFTRGQAIFNSTKSNIYGGDIQTSYKSRWGTTGIGLGAQHTDLKSLKLDTTTRQQVSAFFEHRLSVFNNRLDITPGFMVSHYSDFGSGFFPGIDAGVRLTDAVKAYGSWGKTFRIPTYTDLYFNNGANNNNPLLRPERANTLEFGLKYNKNGLRLAAAWFSRMGDSIIDRVKTDAAQKWFPTNLSSLTVSGIEASFDYMPTIGRGEDFWLKRVNISATYINKVNYITPETVKFSRYAADNLRYQANINITHALFGKLTHSFNTRYFERFILVKNYETYYKGVIADSRLMWTERWGRVFVQGNNLFNKKYVESNGITMPRRWFSVGFDMVMK